MTTIRPAIPEDAVALTEMMHASAAYRGVYATILEGYAVTPSQIEQDVLYVAVQDRKICGFYSVILRPEPELDLMFVADSVKGRGLGAMLFRHMIREAKRRGIPVLKIVSHPPSVGFYQAMGAIIIGTKAPTTKATWSRPILELAIW